MVTLLLRQSGAALRVLLVATVVLGLVYPLAVWGVARLPGLHAPAEGSVATAPDGTPAGSSLIGVDPVPAELVEVAGDRSEKLLTQVEQRRAAIAAREGVAPGAVPADAVTASGSGVDPHISPAYADLQIARVARVTGIPEPRVRQLVAEATSGRVLGFLGEPTVNVTRLNLALAAARPAGAPAGGR